MAIARIYQPSKTAMQSGRGKSDIWMLEFEQEKPRDVEPLMGYTGSADMFQQVKLKFASKDEAVAYATREGLAYQVIEPAQPLPRAAAAYSDNFRSNRVGSWTH